MEALSVNRRLSVPLAEFSFTFARSSGPGGQNVNKVNSKAVLRWNVAASPSLPVDVRSRFQGRFRRRLTREGELVLASQRFRDQARNVDDCLEKLRAMLAEIAVPPKRRRATRPSAGAVERRLTHKRERAGKKQQRRFTPSDE